MRADRAVEDFLTRFPFALPCLLHSALLLLYATAVFCLLEESLGTNLQHMYVYKYICMYTNRCVLTEAYCACVIVILLLLQ